MDPYVCVNCRIFRLIFLQNAEIIENGHLFCKNMTLVVIFSVYTPTQRTEQGGEREWVRPSGRMQ